MTLVPNHLLPSSGNKMIYSVLTWILCLYACSPSTTEAARSPKVIKPSTGSTASSDPTTNDNETVTIDTMQWTVVPEESAPPITTADAEGGVASYALDKVEKGMYKVALMLPMRLEQAIPTLDANNKKFANFYGGIQLAGERALRPEVDLDVYYTSRDRSQMQRILSQLSVDRPDVIIAPYESKLITMAADFARDHRITLISPWKSSSRITKDNLFYLQMRPSIEHYYARLLEHVKYNYKDEEIRIIQNEDGTDKSKIALLQSINEETAGIPLVTPLEVVDVSLDSLMDSEAFVFDSLLTQGVKAFVLPHFSKGDESYAYSCLRKMYAEKLDRDFAIYAMPLILNSDRVDINIWKNLDIRVAEFRFPDSRSPEVQAFKEAYVRKYGWLPTEDSYYGYDLMNFVLQGLTKYGQYFHYYMAGEEQDLMQMNIHVQPYYDKDNSSRPSYMVNDHLYIIEFDEGHFKVKDIR